MCIATLALTLILVPLHHEIIEGVKEKLRLEDQPIILYDKATNAYNISYSIGGALGPIVGGVIYDSLSEDQYSFARLCDYMAFSSLVVGIAYFILNTIPLLC